MHTSPTDLIIMLHAKSHETHFNAAALFKNVKTFETDRRLQLDNELENASARIVG
jgi:hypothetical protein